MPFPSVITIDNHLIINPLANPLTSDRAVPVEDFKGMEYDADYYVENQVLPAVMRIMEVLGYREDDLRYEKAKQVKLAEFVGDPKNLKEGKISKWAARTCPGAPSAGDSPTMEELEFL